MIEGLSLLIAREKKEKRIIGLKVTGSLTLTHIFFVDDFLLSGMVAYWNGFITSL